MKSTTNYQFGTNPAVNMPRSQFNRSHGCKTTFDAAQLIPIMVDEVLPGDTFNVRTAGFVRLATPIYPVMDNMFLDVHYFFVPCRLLWENWQRFMGEKDDPDDTTEYTIPTQTMASPEFALTGSIWDYLGLPTEVVGIEFNVLPFRAYRKIFDDWYRDQNFQPKTLAGPNNGIGDSGGTFEGDIEPLTRNKRHDYFTSCLPWPQKGEDVSFMPTYSSFGYNDVGNNFRGNMKLDTSNGMILTDIQGTPNTSARVLPYWATDNNQGEGTINSLRTAFQIQELLERDARGGTRYTEIILAHFGVVSPDQRLQRAEYLGGGTAMVNITPVPTQAASASSGDTQVRRVGDLGAMGTASFQKIGFSKSFTEHGYIMGIASVRADMTYQNRLDRMWSRQDKLDFYWPSFAHLGEQAVLNKEIEAKGTSVAGDDDVFGYNERYSEYRWKPSQVHGAFKSQLVSGSLDAWHLAYDFGASRPALNQFFIAEQPPVDRVVAVPEEPHFIADFYHSVNAVRPIPMYGTPKSLGRL